MKKIQLIILLQGNFVIIDLNDDSQLKEKIGNAIYDSMVKSKKRPYELFRYGDVNLLAQNIIGWYFRGALENPTDRVINYLDKKIPDTNEGEGWKNE